MELYIAIIRTQNAKLSILFIVSINKKQSLKGVIQDAEYETDVFQNFFYITV